MENLVHGLDGWVLMYKKKKEEKLHLKNLFKGIVRLIYRPKFPFLLLI